MYNSMNSTAIYISENGNDLFNGYSHEADAYGNGPIKSIKRLSEIINTMRAGNVFQPVSVRFIGDYHLDQPICVGNCLPGIFSKDQETRNITFESYGKKRARLIGGRHLCGFKPDVFNGVPCLSLYIPEVKDGTWHFTDLFVDGKAAKCTRYPKKGMLDAVTTEIPVGTHADGSKWFIAKKKDLESIDGIENSIVSFYHYWIDEHTPVESYDKDTGKLVMKNRSRFNISVSYNDNPENPATAASDLHYYLENVPQTFSEPGEWYLDVPCGMLYYIPEEGQSAENIEVLAPTLKQLVKVCGTPSHKAGGIRFKNLDFVCSKGDYTSYVGSVNSESTGDKDGYASDSQSAYGAYGAVSFEFAEDCSVYNCHLSCLGIHGVEIGKGCQNIRVEKCTLQNLGGGGVKISGKAYSDAQDSEADLTSGCIIRGNAIEHCGRRHAAACGILVIHSSHNEISDNHISYLDYTGISVGWVWGYNPSSTYGNIISNNHIHHIGMGNLSDMGGIYTLGAQNGTVIEGNLIHDIRSAHYGGWGIYTDEGSSYILIENNIVYNTNSDCFHQHYGAYNTVRGNVFAFGKESCIRMSRREEHTGAIFEENVLITDGKPVYAFGDDGKHIYPNSCIKSTRNRIWDISGEPFMFTVGGTKRMSLDDWQKVYGLDRGSIISLPENIQLDWKAVRVK